MLRTSTLHPLAVCLLLALADSGRAASSDLDASFGVGGKVTTAFGMGWQGASAVAEQSDGKLVVAGSVVATGLEGFAIARYDVDGSLDPAFGGTGKVVTSFAATDAFTSAMALMADGRIIVGGAVVSGGNQDFALVRYLTDGSLDATFGSGGIVITPVGSGNDGLLGLAVQPDGRIVAVGVAHTGATSDVAVLRYAEDGTLDPTFGGTGKVITPIGSLSDYANDVALQPDGKIVVVGSAAELVEGRFLFAVIRYESDGDLDTSFGGTGKVTTSIGDDDDRAYSVALQTDGKIVVVGYTSPGPGTNFDDFAVVRYDVDGDLDPTFGDAGVVVTPIKLGTEQLTADHAYSVAIQPDGRIVAAGDSYAPEDSTPPLDIDFALVRYTADGALDPTLGGTGKIVTPFGSGLDGASAVTLQADGRIVAVGSSEPATTPGIASFAIARYRPATACPAVRATTCIEGWNAASLLIKDFPGKTRKVVARLLAGPPLARTDFGDPLLSAGTAYALCIYDDTDRLAGKLEVDRAGDACGTSDCWRPLGLLGYRYQDKASAADGVRGVTLVGTSGAQSKVLVQATSRAPKHLVDLPFGIASGLATTSQVTLQLFGSDAPECFSATLSRVLRSDPDFFQAKQ